MSNSLLGSLALHVGLISLILGSAYFRTIQKPFAPTIDVDLVDIEFTTLDQDLSQLKLSQAKGAQKQTSDIKNEPVIKEQTDLTKSKGVEKKPISTDADLTKEALSKSKTLEELSKNSKQNQDFKSGNSQDSDSTNSGSAKVKMSYEQYLISYINRYKTYPRIAERLKQQGIVVPKLVISKDGKLKEVLIEKSSGFSSLDQGTINLIKSLAPFKPLPETLKTESGLSGEDYTIKIPIGYTLIGS